ncbi:MAG: hypothetical protein J0H75_00760, partial [Rhizobiales bacterium]|nr:hypothetical protein [Hyphomicrobiales bacterium]
IKRSGRDLSDEFAYRYGVNDSSEVSAFLLVFRHSVIATGLVFQTEDVFREWNTAEENEQPAGGSS